MISHDKRRQELFAYFEKCVKRHFHFLRVLSYDIDKCAMGWTVTYISDKVKIGIYYERISYEIYLTFSLNESGTKYILDEIIEDDTRKYKCAIDENAIEDALMELSTLTLKYGMPFINGELSVYENVKKKRERNHVEYNLSRIEELASAAWQMKNYNEVIELYESILEHLTKVQRKRLSICRRTTAYDDSVK